VELHFYPGQDLLILINQKKVLATCEAKGGPSVTGSDPRMHEEPTKAGVYTIVGIETYSTPTWPTSRIKWGTPLQDKGDRQNDVWYQMKGGRWASMLKDYKFSRDSIIQSYKRLYAKSEVPPTWVFNDFGPIAIRWFEDMNGNGKLDGHEALSGQMFHTTPVNEAQAATKAEVSLTSSHGCIHLKPFDRDRFIALKAFTKGTQFTVHRYDETYQYQTPRP
jgi:hypothetical protein